ALHPGVAGRLHRKEGHGRVTFHWRDLANCNGSDPDLFFAGHDGEDTSRTRAYAEQTAQALALCAECAVQPECLDYALSQGDSLEGVWGGTTKSQRKAIRRRRRQAS